MLGKELGHEIPTSQIICKCDADYKESDQEDQCFLYLRGNAETILDNVEKIKYLGITITNDLQWSTCMSAIFAEWLKDPWRP